MQGLRTRIVLRRAAYVLPAPTHRRIDPTTPLADMSPAAQREFWRGTPLLTRWMAGRVR